MPAFLQRWQNNWSVLRKAWIEPCMVRFCAKPSFQHRDLRLKHIWISLHDNHHKDIVWAMKEWLRKEHFKNLKQACQPPDLNPIENLWKYFKVVLSYNSPKNMTVLEKICMEELTKIVATVHTSRPTGNLWPSFKLCSSTFKVSLWAFLRTFLKGVCTYVNTYT